MLSTPRPKGQKVDHTTDKTILLRIHPMPARCTPREPEPPAPKDGGQARNRMNVLFTMSNNPQAAPPGQHPAGRKTPAKPHIGQPKGRHPGANRRPNPNGGARRDRTDDLMLAKHALSQLSYGPGDGKGWAWQMVGLGRLELPTSRLSSARSNQLSYKPGTARPRTRPASRPRRTPPARMPHGHATPDQDAAGLSEKKEKRRRRSPANGSPKASRCPK